MTTNLWRDLSLIFTILFAMWQHHVAVCTRRGNLTDMRHAMCMCSWSINVASGFQGHDRPTCSSLSLDHIARRDSTRQNSFVELSWVESRRAMWSLLKLSVQFLVEFSPSRCESWSSEHFRTSWSQSASVGRCDFFHDSQKLVVTQF